MAEQLATLIFSATGQISVPVHEEAVLARRSINFSGVVFTQNRTPTGYVGMVNDNYVIQEFTLPADYKRVSHRFPRRKHFESRDFIEDSPRRHRLRHIKTTTFIPALSGFQFYVGVDLGYAETATFEYFVELYLPDKGWVGLKKGVAVGAPADGDELWFNIYFDAIGIEEAWLDNLFRIGIRGRSASAQIVDEVVQYTDATQKTILINSTEVDVSVLSPVPLEEGGTYPFEFNGVPSIIVVQPGSGLLLYSVQQGITKLYYTSPNPLFATKGRVYLSDGITPLQQNGNDTSLNFRILAEVADDGTDFFGNVYRSTLVKQEPDNIAPWAPITKFWLSKPNPSKFATEALYFDMRDGVTGSAVVIDTVFLNPITPGIYFNIYYSNDHAPGTDAASWDSLLWTYVPKKFQMNKQDMYYLPEPILAKYVKIEFTHLQGHTYNPGEFQKPTVYREFPQWVQNYFAAVEPIIHDPLIAPKVTTNYNTIQVLYPPPPFPASPARPRVSFLQNFLLALASVAPATYDSRTLAKINTLQSPFSYSPALRGKDDDVLGFWAKKHYREHRCSVEIQRPAVADTTPVSTPDRQPAMVEKVWPVMYFYLTCRHGYREIYGLFENGIAYYAGVQQIAFYREKYDKESDTKLYTETVGDAENIDSSDFLLDPVNFRWVTYGSN